MDGLIDTSIIIDVYRGYNVAVQWFSTNSTKVFGITPIVWMEMVGGAPNKQSQQKIIQLLSLFPMVYLTLDDQIWAMSQFAKFKLSHNVDLTDALIAAQLIA